MKKSILKERSFSFSLIVISFCKELRKREKEYILTNQLELSATAIGALIREAEYGQSRRDFISKMSIALKEANETGYWLDLLESSGYMESEKYKDLSDILKQLVKMLASSIITAKQNLNCE